MPETVSIIDHSGNMIQCHLFQRSSFHYSSDGLVQGLSTPGMRFTLSRSHVAFTVTAEQTDGDLMTLELRMLKAFSHERFRGLEEAPSKRMFRIALFVLWKPYCKAVSNGER